MPKQILFFLFLFAIGQTVNAQNKSPLLVTCERVQDSDSIWVSIKQSTINRGTLMIAVKAKDANISDTLYYPVIDTLEDFLLTVPESFQNDHISLTALYYGELREIEGRVNNRKTDSDLSMMLFGRGLNYTKTLDVNEDKGFVLPKLIFENKATVFFSFVGTKRKPDITIDEFPRPSDYDSLMTTTFNFGANKFTSTEYDSLKLIGKLPANAVRVEGKGKELEQIVISGKRKTKLEKYKEKYTSGLFNSIMEREYDLLDNDEILGFSDCLTYLQARAPSITMSMDQSTGMQTMYLRREKIKAFFIDEIEVDINQMQMLDVASIAYIKLMPTVLVGSMTVGPGGGVAVYTRKGDFVRKASLQNNYFFSIKGYTPSGYILFSAK